MDGLGMRLYALGLEVPSLPNFRPRWEIARNAM